MHLEFRHTGGPTKIENAPGMQHNKFVKHELNTYTKHDLSPKVLNVQFPPNHVFLQVSF